MRGKDAERLHRTIMAGLVQVSDQQASEGVELFPRLTESGELMKAGTRINWNGMLKRASVDLWDLETNNPDNAPAIWEDIQYVNGVRVIPEVITATTAFSLNELGWWQGSVYRSLRDGNTFNPSVTPEWWEVVE